MTYPTAMQRIEGGWTQVEEGAFVRAYDFGAGLANSFACRLDERRLLVISPGCGLSAEVLDALDAQGEVVALVAPNAFHHLGLPEWHARYPRARLFGPPRASRRIARHEPTVPRLESLAALRPLLPEQVEVFVPPHLRFEDLMARVRVPAGYVWFVNDLIGNHQKLPRHPVMGFLFKVTRSGPGLAVNWPVARTFVRDRAAFRAWLLAEIDRYPPIALVPGHGAAVQAEGLAARLSALVRERL